MSTKSGPTEKVWRDGVLVDWADATVHVLTHAIHYGSSVFEGIRAYQTPTGGAVFRLREHMRRLLDSAKIYRMTIPHSLDTLCDAVVETVAANELRSCYIRPLIARTGEQMGFNTKGVPIETFVICWKWGSYLGEEGMRDGVDVRISSWRRAAGSTFPTMAKAGGNYLNSQLSLMEARLDDYVEGIMLDTAGHVAEGSGENLFAIRDGVMYTAPFSAGVLHGITRDSVLTLAREAGYEVREMVMPREFLYIADEVFFTGTAAEITPVRSIDRISIGNGARGPMTKVIQERYLGIAKGELPDTYSWLTPVPVAANSTR